MKNLQFYKIINSEIFVDSTKSALTLDTTTHDTSDLTARETANVEGNKTQLQFYNSNAHANDYSSLIKSTV